MYPEGSLHVSRPTRRGLPVKRIQTVSSIRTSSEIKGFRSLVHSVGAPLRALDQGRIQLGYARRIAARDRRNWLDAKVC